jgi:hypothetical protein
MKLATHRTAALALLLSTFIPGCGGGDGGPTTPPPPPGDGSVVILSAANAGDWQRGTPGPGVRFSGGAFILRDSTYDCYQSSWGDHLCHQWVPRCTITSTRRVDFRPYATARLQFRVRGVLGGTDGTWCGRPSSPTSPGPRT